MRREHQVVRLLGCTAALLASACTFTPGVLGQPPSQLPDGSLPDVASEQLHVQELAAGAAVSGGPHADFPALVALTADWLRTTDAGGRVAHPSGSDLWFSEDATGTAPLAYEVEAYDSAAGELVAWVKVPLLAAGTTVYLHAGDPALTTSRADPHEVWTAGYASVWHLTGDAIVDATEQTTPGASNQTSPASGQIAAARSFAGASASIVVAATPVIDNVFAGGGTAEAWFFATGWGDNNLGRIFDKGSGSTVAIGMCNAVVPAAFLFGHGFSSSGPNWCTPQGSLTLNRWTHVATVYDDGLTTNTPAIYIDGMLQAVTTPVVTGTGRSDADTDLFIGNRTTGGRAFEGALDELRLSRVARSAGWIATTAANQRDPAAFWELRTVATRASE